MRVCVGGGGFVPRGFHVGLGTGFSLKNGDPGISWSFLENGDLGASWERKFEKNLGLES